ncbi:DUF5682 family protein [Siphonobacter curvatus]|uniref:Uncharacterized protein n=1 Tax=Siphonobacter curvatus TaxID=2094562 RepID=A0A2S7IIL0_9BACT|nr:DUF5682 family protein [Siphonobacter curvatus]PQA56230.1 hypothetical protein C5O19_17950 [Siphonobacter curvatus]
MTIHLLGIRHHGVGSARRVQQRLTEIQPDLILVEGPPELTELLHWTAHKDLQPPVAVLAYDADEPQKAVFYPFVEYSPEWVAVQYAHRHAVPVRMTDMPLLHSLAKEEAPKIDSLQKEQAPEREISPLHTLAELAGYETYHDWWEERFEQDPRIGDSAAYFEAVQLTMETARAASAHPTPQQDAIREAFMRQHIREAQKEGFANIAVVCGAWHVPALTDLKTTKKEDTPLVKGLPKAKVRLTWIPWTNTRMSWWSGYGAGIHSPGWYEHRWYQPEDRGEQWLTRVARLFRRQKMDVSTAHIIEAFRLADSLATLRNLPRPGLNELNEATQSVMCMGDGILMRLVEKELIVAHRMGQVPDELPKLPIQTDFETIAKKLRLEIREETKFLELDLRKDLDLSRSIFLHRLRVLEVPWGSLTGSSGKGTFKEGWQLRWSPEAILQLIEKAIWGNRIEDAATQYLLDQTQRSTSITELAQKLEAAIPAELFGVLDGLIHKISELATVSADMQELMMALQPLVTVSRYGSVRKTDLSTLMQVVEGLLTRICIGLPTACYGLDDENARRMLGLIRQVDESVRLLERESLVQAWRDTLWMLATKEHLPALITGGSTRLLFDSKVLEEEQMTQRFERALSKGNEPSDSAAWLEGFLSGSGLILLYDPALWKLLYTWVAELAGETFMELLPVLRRTFATFEVAERRQLGEKAKQPPVTLETAVQTSWAEGEFDWERAEASLSPMKALLGLN